MSWLIVVVLLRNVLSRTAHLSPTSLSTQVTPATGAITYTKVYENGAAVITLANGASITWDKDLFAWVRVTESWWRQAQSSSSSSSPTRRHGRHSEPGLSPVAASNTHGGSGESQSAFDRALNLGHLETKLHAAKLLGSPIDYSNALMVYAGRLADEGLVERANELVRDLCGPLFWWVIYFIFLLWASFSLQKVKLTLVSFRDPATSEPVSSSKWEPKVVGLNKRELLQDILPIFG
jgi:protein HIRA/HIR1